MRRLALLAALLAPCAAAAHEQPAYHLYVPHRAPPAAASTAPQMLYYGGQILAAPKVVSVLWGSTVASSTVSAAPGFLTALVNSTFVDGMDQYSTVGITGVNGKPGSNQSIARGSFAGQIQITPYDTNTVVTDSAIHKELLLQIAHKHLPAQSANTLYIIFFPSSITITLDGSKSCSAFGAYHEAVSAKPETNNIFYAVIPDCGGGFGADLTFATSHEFAEAVSDAIPTPGSHPAYPQAWNNKAGYEIADLCETVAGTTLTAGSTSYAVTKYFQNSINGCSKGPFTGP